MILICRDCDEYYNPKEEDCCPSCGSYKASICDHCEDGIPDEFN